MPTYSIACEISEPTAMWTRPDTDDAPVNYPAPAFAAVKGIFESIIWRKSAEVVPTRRSLDSFQERLQQTPTTASRMRGSLK